MERLEATKGGRTLISAFLLSTLIAILISNIFVGSFRNVGWPLRPYVVATGLRQDWYLFAPERRQETMILEAKVSYADGAMASWAPPRGDRFLGAYRAWRWRRWRDQLVIDPFARRQAAAWIARQHRRGGRPPTEVTLLVRSYRAHPPGSGRRGRTGLRESRLVTLKLPEGSR